MQNFTVKFHYLLSNKNLEILWEVNGLIMLQLLILANHSYLICIFKFVAVLCVIPLFCYGKKDLDLLRSNKNHLSPKSIK